MTWKERLIGVPLAAVGAVLLLATGGAMLLTRTDWGRERVRAYALEQLNGAIRGRVEIDAVLEGDLLRQVRMAGVRVYEPDGRRFARVDTVALHYRWSDFLFGNISLAGVELLGPVVEVRALREGGWNFEEVFRGAGPPGPQDEGNGGPRRQIVLREVTIRSGDVTLRMPWEPGGEETPETTRWFVESTDEGWERVFRLEGLDTELPIARVEAPEDLGRLFQIAQLSGRATIIGEPFRIEQLRAELEVHGDTLAFDVWEAGLPSSHLFGEGWVTLSGELRYDLMLQGNPVTSEDLTWLLPWLPPGRARLDFSYRSLPDGTVLEAQNALWESPDARVSGRFGLTRRDGADGLRFDRVDLDIERANQRIIRQLFGWTPPDSGRIRGRVRLDGPLSALRVDADLNIQQEGRERASKVSANGVVRTGSGLIGAEDLELTFDTLRLGLVRAFEPSVVLRGGVSGRANLTGRLSDGLSVRFELEQRDRGLTPIQLSGRGTLRADSGVPLRLDVTARSRSLSLTTLAEYYPVIPFRGDFRGDLSARGTLADLDVELRLLGAGDSLRATGAVALAKDTLGYRGRIQGWRVRLPEFREGLPQSDLDFRAEFEARGTSLPDMTGRGRVEVFASFVGGVGINSARADLRLAERRLRVDSAVVGADFGELSANGALSLSPEITDSLAFELDADSLGALNSWLFPERGPSVVPGALTSVADDVSEAETRGVEGSAQLSAWLIRQEGRFRLRGDVEGAAFAYDGMTADSFRIESLEIAARSPAMARGDVVARGVAFGGLRFERVEATASLVDSLAGVQFEIAKAGARIVGSGWAMLGEMEQIGLDDLVVELGASTWTLTDSARFRLDASGAWSLRGVELLSGSRRVAIDGSVGTSGPVSLQVQLAGVELGEVSNLWPDTLGIAGRLELSAALSGRVRDPVVEGEFEIAEGRVFGMTFTSFRGELGYQAGNLALDASMWHDGNALARLSGTLPLDLQLPGPAVRLPDRAIDMTLEGDSIPLSLVTVFTNQVTSVRGTGQASLQILGTPQNVVLQGTARLADGRFRLIGTGITYDRLTGELVFKGETVRLREVTFYGASGGQALLDGVINFARLNNPEFNLTLSAQELPAYDQLDARAIVSGQITLEGPYNQPAISGGLSVMSGVLFIEEIGRQSEIIDPFEDAMALWDTLFAGTQGLPGRENPFLRNMTIGLHLTVERDTWLRSEEANVEIAGDLNVQMQRAQNELRIDGTLRAVRGEYRMYNKRFEVVEGTIEFVGTPAMNPNLRIVARYTVRTQKEPIEIRLIIGGTLEDMTLTLESDHQPPIPESELLSYLLFGRPSYELTRTSEESSLLRDITSGVPQAFFGYALGSLLVGETGIAYVDVSRAPLTPTTEGEYRSGVGLALEATQVEVGWYLAPTVFVSVAQHLVGVVRPTVRLEWRLDERLTLRGVTEPRFGQEGTLFYGGPDSDLDQSIGLFLFYGWAY